MKQVLSVRALIRDGNKTLLLKRANGRQSILGKYELPGGKISYGEQPEDAIARYLRDDAGLTMRTAQLYDVFTYIDHDDRDIQYTFILYLVSLEQHERLTLSENYSHYLWKSNGDFHQDELTESAKLLLGISAQAVVMAKEGEVVSASMRETPIDEDHLISYSDGGSRGNPGPSASGYIIMDSHEEVIHQGGMYLGITTNNQAEYHGVRLALEKALEMGAKTIDCRMDSLLVVNQLNGVYEIKNRELWPIHDRVKELASQFERVSYSHVKREFNQLADGMVNKILNAHAKAAE